MPTKTATEPDHAQFSFKAFLSHRYKSPKDNLYFFNLFSEIAEVQFEVDEGTSVLNVTRLERMIRDSNGFIGIYPFSGTWEEAQERDNLLKASQYFRLELDLAIRSRKPSIIFYDRAYGDMLQGPPGFIVRDFDGNEVRSAGGSPSADDYRTAFANFQEVVRKGMAYAVAQRRMPSQKVGIALPQKTAWGGYGDFAEEIKEAVEKIWNGEVITIPWPPVLDRSAFIRLQDLSWAIVDIGKDMAETGLPAYLHGRFVPMMRVKEATDDSRFEKMIVGNETAGYVEDILAWKDKDALLNGLMQRIRAINAKVRRISTAQDATNYFEGAAKRKEPVFFSYSGTNADKGAALASELKRHFQQVFDYKDGKSIRTGEPWLDEIFDQLAQAAIGVSLFSKGYVESENCKHEARQMVAQRDSKKMQLFPISIGADDFELPSWIESIQCFHWSDNITVEEVVSRILSQIKPA